MNGNGVRRSACFIIPVVLAIVAWTAVLPASASTAGTFSSPTPCPHISPKLQLGTTTPVLLVHGFNEGPGVFTTGSPSLESAITHALGSSVTLVTFDYSEANTQWVTSVPIGPALAQCIIWLAHTSDMQGGPGKVIIVAHSMGGLAVRCAVDPACVKGNPAADPSLIGLVVTLGTPNTGSILGNFASFVASGYEASNAHAKPTGPFESVEALLCEHIPQCPSVAAGITTPAAQAMQIGSAALNPDTLKPLPSSIPLDAIAGKITLTTTLMDAEPFPIPIGDIGDLVVPVASAQDPQGPSHPGPGNWQPTIDCGSVPVDSLPEWVAGKLAEQQPLVKCWHETETTDPAWQSDIITAIKAYLAAGLVTASLPVVSCPTSVGINRPAVSLPRSRPVAVPQALAAGLSVYADTQGVMELLGPKGWSCTAAYGADGSGGITVYPSGEGPSSPVAIVGSETSACAGCTLAQACRLFPGAATALRNALGEACPARLPVAETVATVAAGIVAFEDPPGVKGDGQPSGGQYPANGVMTYHPSAPDGSWQETCTLPASEKDVCTAVLNTFVSWYGQR